MTPSDAVLAIPDGWVIDRIARERLGRQLARADDRVCGIATMRRDLFPGASYRVVAERAALDPASAVAPSNARTFRGAVLVRPGVAVRIDDGAVAVEGEVLLVDRGATVHDPWRESGRLEAASPLGRPPFPCRPVVLFLGTEPDPDLADWVRATVNKLMRLDTEGRIAVPEPTGGLHLTRPCAPSAESVAALKPDVVVALDEDAARLAEQWLAGNRSATIIELTRDTTDAVELVSWRIGRTQGRTRARIGRGIDAVTLSDLVRRLCAGPQPIPPSDRDRFLLHPWKRRPNKLPPSEAPEPAFAVVVLLARAEDRTRFEGFADSAAAVGAHVTISVIDDESSEAAAKADLVWLRGLSQSDGAMGLVRQRRRAGRATIVDIAAEDVRLDSSAPARAPALLPAALALAQAAGVATTTSRGLQASLAAVGVRALVLPTLLTRARAERLRRLREGPRGGEAAVLGWHTGTGHGVTAPEQAAVSSAIAALLRERPKLTVEVVGDATDAATAVASNRRVTVRSGDPESRTVARWTAQLWTAPALEVEMTGDLRPAIHAHMLGVPTLVAVQHPAVSEGLVVRALAVENPGDSRGWRAVAPLLDAGDEWSQRSQEAIHLADALYGPKTSIAVMNRFRGWLEFET